jgi:raffinose/stachyose/melibiose transport system substrate-binding protein
MIGVMALAFAFANTAFAKDTPRTFTVRDATSFAQAIAAINSDRAGGSYTITLTGSFQSDPVILSGVAKIITLKGDTVERRISNKRNDDKSFFFVPDDITLVLDNNLTIDGGSKKAVLVDIYGGGLIMKAGAILRGGSIGVCVWDGNFTMSGGTISGNSASGNDTLVVGGVFVGDGSSFTMSGGTISDNSASGNDSLVIGGVFVGDNSSRFTMSGGTISDNSASGNDSLVVGGVFVRDGRFTMSGGTISSNSTSGDNDTLGGGVCIWKGSSFTMSGGSISGNSTSGNDAFGGGVHVGGGSSSFTISGGMIRNNLASGNDAGGGGVYVGDGSFTMNGGTINGNSVFSLSGGDAFGGGVYVLSGIFVKTGGTIDGTNKANTGMVVYVYNENESKLRNSAAGPEIVLDSRISGNAGGWKDEPAQSTVTLKVLNYFDRNSAIADIYEQEVWQKFQTAHPNIKIQREDLYNDPFHNKLEAYAASGNLPDVMYAWPSGRSTTLYANRLLKDLTPLIRKDRLTASYHPLALDRSQFAGNYVGILTQGITSSHAFYVNNAVLKAAGLTPAKTYAELVKQVPILKAKGYETVLMANMDTWVMQSCLFSLIVGRFCGEGWDQRILNRQAKFTDPDFVAALTFVKRLYDDGVLSKNTLSTDYGAVVGLFAGNKGAYFIDGDWRVGAFTTDYSYGYALISPSNQKNISITVFPDITGAKLNRSTSGILGTGWGIRADIPAGSEREAAAWELVKWLTSKEVQTLYILTGGISTPSRTDIDVSRLSLEPMQKAIATLSTQYDVVTPVIDGVFAGDVYTPLNDGLQAIGMGTQSPLQVAIAVQNAFDAWRYSY